MTTKKTNIDDNRAYITQRVNQLSLMGAKDEEIKAVLNTNTLSHLKKWIQKQYIK